MTGDAQALLQLLDSYWMCGANQMKKRHGMIVTQELLEG